jgi:hypothetical protein
VTPTWWPMSSSVSGPSSPRPYLSSITRRSRHGRASST